MGVHRNDGAEDDNEEEQKTCWEDEGEEQEQDEEEVGGEERERLTGYEIERQQRIQRNAAKLAALKLPSLASSLLRHHSRKLQQPLMRFLDPSASPRRSKRLKTHDRKPALFASSSSCGSSEQSSDSDSALVARPGHRRRHYGRKPNEANDFEYRPSDNGSDSELEDDCGSGDGFPQPDFGRQQPETEMDLKNLQNGAEDDENISLQQALALSMGVSMEDIIDTNVNDGMPNLVAEDREQRKKDQIKDLKNRRGSKTKQALIDFGYERKRRKQSMKHLLQLTEDEINALFFLFDERGRGKFSVRELEHVAYSHDFTWSKEEIFDMIDIFDDDKDGQLDITEFRSMANHSNMIKLSVKACCSPQSYIQTCHI